MVNVMTVLNMMVNYKCQVLNFNYLTYFLPKTKKSCIGFPATKSVFNKGGFRCEFKVFVFLLLMILTKTFVTHYLLAWLLVLSQTKALQKQENVSSAYLAVSWPDCWPDCQRKMKKNRIPHCLESGRISGQLLAGFWRGIYFNYFPMDFLNPFEFKFMFGLGNP